MRYVIELTTLDPVSLPATTATEGGRASLDYIPGSALQGALAAREYARLAAAGHAWDAFHSGALSLGNAYLVHQGERALPLPMSFHHQKGQDASEPGNWVNLSKAERSEGLQYKQLRSNYLTGSGLRVQVKREMHVKTALDPGTQTAGDHQLFQLEAIAAQQHFMAVVELADTLEPARQHVLQQLVTGLEGQVFRLGRSRNTEFGRVQVNQVTAIQPVQPEAQGRQLTLWLLSDTEVINQAGQPTTAPSLADLGLDLEGDLQRHHSFVRAGGLTRHNQQRAGYDSERWVMQKGSVLVYRLTQEPDAETLAKLSRGIGGGRATGQGEVMVNPSWQQHENFQQASKFFAPVKVHGQQPGSQSAKAPDTPLVRWLKAQDRTEQQHQGVQQRASELRQQVLHWYESAREFKGIPQEHQAGPSRTQWGLLLTAIKNHNGNDPQALMHEVEQICKAKNDEWGWGISWLEKNGRATDIKTMAATFKELAEHELSPSSKATGDTSVQGRQALDQATAHPPSVETFRELLTWLARYDLSSSEGLKQAKADHQHTFQPAHGGAV